jgi:hypothetical protein
MNKMLQPTGIAMVGLALFLIYLMIQSALAEPKAASYPESLDKIKDFHNQFTSPSYPSVGLELSKVQQMAETSR